MLGIIRQSNLHGKTTIPGSKSHMIRALYLGSFARGMSKILSPVKSNDALSCLGVCRSLGAKIDTSDDNIWRVEGGSLSVPRDILDVGNSGTTMYIGAGLSASLGGYCVFTGDQQITRRPIQPVLDALKKLNVEAFTTRANGSPPFLVKGPIRGGKTTVKGIVSAYVSSILLGAALAEGDCEIEVDGVNEIPYIQMTIEWAKRLGVSIEAESGMEKFFIAGGQKFSPFEFRVPGDFSSATFPLIGAAISDSDVTLLGLNMKDVQGDKYLVHVLKEMGADIEIIDDGKLGIRVRGGAPLKGTTIDCSITPDSIPILSILGCYAQDETRLVNIESSRLKESDRPLLMCKELAKMGGRLELNPDSLIIKNQALKGSYVESYGDHRIAMALCIAGLIAEGATLVTKTESAAVSYPGFQTMLTDLGADALFVEDNAKQD
ncbi:MAG: 3-phosphoshikimate 1-carboxyvinyltransferase [Spirochaetia bacterium]|nr:3-phosphoshikimate 1-carboxyvinyltransferase [Spirochaetia bacterium]